jgi:hypothetical protein
MHSDAEWIGENFGAQSSRARTALADGQLSFQVSVVRFQFLRFLRLTLEPRNLKPTSA